MISFLKICVNHYFKWNKPESQLIAKLILPNKNILRDNPFVLVYKKLLWFQYKEHKVCLRKIPTQGMFKQLSTADIYYQNMGIMACDF